MSCKNLNKETLLNIEEIRRLIWPRRKRVFLARITLLNCMQDDLLIKYEVYQIAHELWQALKEKVWWTFSYKAERICNEIQKLQDTTKPYKETTSQGDKKNDKRA